MGPTSVDEGRFFLLHQKGRDASAPNEIVLVTNWLTELERLVPSSE